LVIFTLVDEVAVTMDACGAHTRTLGDPYEILERAGLRTRGDELDRRAGEPANLGSGKSLIYDTWIRYARQHQERAALGLNRFTVFGSAATVPSLQVSLRKHEVAACSIFHFAKGAFHDVSSSTHD
jgi:hypothetical protein